VLFVAATLIMLLVIEMVVALIIPGNRARINANEGDSTGLELLPKYLRLLIPAIVLGPLAVLLMINPTSAVRHPNRPWR